MPRPLKLGTRGSALAQWQADCVIEHVTENDPAQPVTKEIIHTTGDRRAGAKEELGDSTGWFTKELEAALLNKSIDLAVHSLKDLPTDLPPDLKVAAVLPRGTPYDCVVCRAGVDWADRPPHLRVGTSSPRRTAQLLRQDPGLRILEMHGNLDTRLRKLEEGQCDAIVVAAAGVKRLGQAKRIGHLFSVEEMVPAAGQGIIAIEARTKDREVLDLLEDLDDPMTRWAAEAERALLRRLRGGCQLPVGIHAWSENGEWVVMVRVCSPDGGNCIHVRVENITGDRKELVEMAWEGLVEQEIEELLNEIRPH